MNGGIEIARHREIDQEEGASLAGGQRLLDLLTGENPTLRARRRQHDVRAHELLLDALQHLDVAVRQGHSAKQRATLIGRQRLAVHQISRRIAHL